MSKSRAQRKKGKARTPSGKEYAVLIADPMPDSETMMRRGRFALLRQAATLLGLGPLGGPKIEVGDYIIMTFDGYDGVFQFETVGYERDPRDMWKASLRWTGEWVTDES